MSNLPALPQGFQLPAIFADSNIFEQLVVGGQSTPRISLKANRFRFIEGGKEIGMHNGLALEVVLLGGHKGIGRVYYKGEYNPNSKEKPTCFSKDGDAPDVLAQEKQSSKCATCPQNQLGSGKPINNKLTRACSFKKRVVVAPKDLSKAYALDLAATSIFDNGNPAQNLYGFKAYIEMLSQPRNGLPKGINPLCITTSISFDANASVPKLFFGVVNWLDEASMYKAAALAQSEEVKAIIDEGVAQDPGFDEANLSQAKPAPEPAAAAPSMPAPEPAKPAPQPAPAPKPAATSNILDKLADFDD